VEIQASAVRVQEDRNVGVDTEVSSRPENSTLPQRPGFEKLPDVDDGVLLGRRAKYGDKIVDLIEVRCPLPLRKL